MTWLTYDKDGNPLCNFRVRVVGKKKTYTNAVGKPTLYIQIYLDFGKGDTEKQKVYSIPVEEIDRIHWKDLDIRCNYEPNISVARVERYLNCTIREELEKVPENLCYVFTHVGMYKIEGKLVFCTGKEVIKSSVETLYSGIEIGAIEQLLEVDEQITEAEAIVEMFDFIRLSPNPGRIMLAYKLGYLMRQAYVDIGKTPKGCIYLYGRSGIQKTTFSSFLVQTYNRGGGIKSPSRLDASIPAVVKILMENPNDVVILDDLFPTDSVRKRRQMEDTLIEVVRYIADGTVPARMKGKQLLQQSPQCGVIFTGEYVIGKGSDAARILPVEMMKPDGNKLKHFQEHPINTSTFYYYYISWFIENYDDICAVLKKMWFVYEKDNLRVHDRLREMHYFLSTAYFLFLQYCVEQKCISKTAAIRLYYSFCDLLTKLVRKQNKRIDGKQNGEFETEDYLQRLCKLYRSGQMSIARDINQFDKKLHDGLLHRNRIYLRSDKISAYFPDSTVKEVMDFLATQGALEVGKGSRTKQISQLNGMRFYVILSKYLN